MLNRIVHLVVLIALVASATAQKERQKPASDAELAGITERGRALAAYDVAAWHATDAFVAATSPQDRQRVRYFIARKNGSAWEVVFGDFNQARDRFSILYEAQQGSSPTDFTLKSYEQPKDVSGFYLLAAKALELTRSDFQHESRPYNFAVLPADAGQLYVYSYPAQTDAKIWPLGGDVRYLISSDASAIVERRRMHSSIIEFSKPPQMEKVDNDLHTAVLDEVPEDSDVFFTMSRQPAVNHFVISKHFVYLLYPDGKAIYLMTVEAFKKLPR